MSNFKVHYAVLSVLLLAGIGGSLYTILDNDDPRIGAFSAGLTIGVMLAMYLVRTAQLEFSKDNKVNHLNFHSPIVEFSKTPPDKSPDPDGWFRPEESHAEDVHAKDRQEQNIQPAATVGNIVEFSTEGDPDSKPEPELVKLDESKTAPLCSCICGCEHRSKGGYIDMCGNCRRWWQQQSLKCKCDYTTHGYCKCGAVRHEPAQWQNDFSQETLGGAAA